MATYDVMEFSKKLKLLAGKHRYSQATLAQQIGVSQNLVSLWMRGASTPDLYQAAKISEVLGVDVNYLANDAQDDPTPPELSDGERAAVDLIRAMRLDKQEALRRLASPSPQPNVVYRPTGPGEYPPAGVYIPPGSPLHAPETPQKKRRG